MILNKLLLLSKHSSICINNELFKYLRLKVVLWESLVVTQSNGIDLLNQFQKFRICFNRFCLHCDINA